MRTAAAALLLAGGLGACTTDGVTSYGVGVGYGTGGYGYYDPYIGHPYYDDYSGSYYGSVLFGGSWYRGPLRYRHGRFGREYWLRDGWRRPERERPDDNVTDDDRSQLHPRLRNLGNNDAAPNPGAPPAAQRRGDTVRAAPVRDRAAPVRERAVPVRERTAPVRERAAPVRERAAPVRERTAAAPRQERDSDDRSELHPRLQNLGD